MSNWIEALGGRCARAGWIVIVAAALGAGCGPSAASGDDDDDTTTTIDAAAPVPGTLRVAPGDVVLELASDTTGTQAYTAIFTDDDGVETDVTGEATFSVTHPALGSFTGNVFTSAVNRAGQTTVWASARGASAEARLTLRLTHVIVTDGAPADAPGRFDGADGGGAAPEIVYPPAGVIVPPNLNLLELHYRPGAGNTVFEIVIAGVTLSLKIYVACTALADGCAFVPDEDTWTLLAEAARGDDLTITVRGLDGSAPTPLVGASAPQTIGFTAEDLLGGIYYWNAGAGNIKRYDFGRRGQSAEDYLNQAQAGATTCVGCHAISRDGKRIAVGLDIPAPSVIKAFSVGTREQLWSAGMLFGGGGGNFYTFSPDNNQIITSNGVNMTLRDGTTGAALMDPLVAVGAMPDWSPDGTKVVYAVSDSPPPCLPGVCGAPGIGSGNIVVMTAGTWTDSTTLVPSGGANNYYPAYAPDGDWIVYNRTALADSYDAADAQVWVVAANGGTPLRLATASPDPGGDSWPKWAPYVHTHKGRQIYWLTFSSRRDYGLRLRNSELADDSKLAQVWMVAFDPAAAAAGDDPGLPSFWLPFQDLSSGNHIAQWVEEIDRQPCERNEDCPGNEFCEDGYCLPYVE